MWPIVGLSFGTVLGLAGAFGGFAAFAPVSYTHLTLPTTPYV